MGEVRPDQRRLFAERLAELLALSGLPLDRVADRANKRKREGEKWRVTTQRLSDWQSGRHLPHSEAAFGAVIWVLVRHCLTSSDHRVASPELLSERAWWRLLRSARSYSSLLAGGERGDVDASSSHMPHEMGTFPDTSRVSVDVPGLASTNRHRELRSRLESGRRVRAPQVGGGGSTDREAVTQVSPPLSARSAYLEQVRRIAPPEPPGLVGRQVELGELARFCLEQDSDPYAWWQADAWTGKSALLSTFVLRPPPELADRVRLVSFFITARLAAQDTRESFIQVLLEQLAWLLGEPLPPVLPEATQEAYLLELVSRAAGACSEMGGRLVLVVDGLDEDRGVTTGQGAHSIAGLLPADPPFGMRVIVAGRPNPPIPDDVPDWHPLRDRNIIRSLAASPYAGDLKRLSRQELRRQLVGSRAEQDVLGLLASARGGLSVADLAELAGIPLWEVEEVLHSAAGRTFTRRASRWAPGCGPETYLLGHEELQIAAEVYLGGDGLAAFRERLHAWAEAWRARGWPAGTPEYLLGGYFRLLQDLEDMPRLTTYAMDQARHDRMLDVTGGDVAAMAETRTVLDRIAAQDSPDLNAALGLACHRDHLANRNAHIPAGLPAVWAALGHLQRAEAFAASVADPVRRAWALARVAGALAKAGQHERSAIVFDQAEAVARSDSESIWGVWALARVAGEMAAAGQREEAAAICSHAETLAASFTDPGEMSWALALISAALATADQHERATELARSITDPYWRAEALAQVAGALAAAGQTEGATVAAAQAEATARSVADPDTRAEALAQIAAVLTVLGHHEQGNAIVRSITDPYRRAEAWVLVAWGLAVAGQYEQATVLAGTIVSPYLQSGALGRVAWELARAGQWERATAVADQGVKATRGVTDPYRQADALTRLAGALAEAGQFEQAAVVAAQAEAGARSAAHPYQRAGAMGQLAGALAGAGQYEQATAVACTVTSPDWRAQALAWVAEALAEAGQHEKAAEMAAEAQTAACSVKDPDTRAEALARVAGTLAALGLHDEATAAAAQAEAFAASITDSGARAWSLAWVAGALAEAGRHEQAAVITTRAETAARSTTDPRASAETLARVAGALAEAGQYEQAAAIAARAETAARSVTDPDTRAEALARVAVALATVGQNEHAVVIAGLAEAATNSVASPEMRAEILAQVAEVKATAGDVESGCRLAALACATGVWTTAVRPVLLLAPGSGSLVLGLLEV
jgi:tetratricopeptide (TPR) repeat protein